MMIFSLYGKKRVPIGGMNHLQVLQQQQRYMTSIATTMSKVNAPNVIVTPLIESKLVNECKNEEKDIIIYRIGCEEPMPVVEEPVIEMLHNPKDNAEEVHNGEEEDLEEDHEGEEV
jgi:hypothetical protein